MTAWKMLKKLRRRRTKEGMKIRRCWGALLTMKTVTMKKTLIQTIRTL
jgi:hypothetical protein